MREQFLWSEKYRPQTVEDCILPDGLKQTFQKFVDEKNIPNLLLSGSSGVGKTTVARAIVNSIGADYIIINGSLNGNIDTLRNDIRNYAATVSFTDGRKYVIIDEMDYVNQNSTQPALRNFMEEFSLNCGFIFTCNFKNRIIAPLHSRCACIEFKINQTEKKHLASQFLTRTTEILDGENVTYDKKVVAQLIIKYFPDWRRVLNELQRYAINGTIDSGIFSQSNDTDIKDLLGYLKNKQFDNMRKWVANNTSIDMNMFFRSLYDSASGHIKQDSIPQLVLILADYQYKAAFSVDQEINLAACLTQIMVDVEFI